MGFNSGFKGLINCNISRFKFDKILRLLKKYPSPLLLSMTDIQVGCMQEHKVGTTEFFITN